jgi:predicted short-subunit dehydrogenase-like oxidoreductase (DUF2520 family)
MMAGRRPAGVLCSRPSSTAEAVAELGDGFAAADVSEVIAAAPLVLVATPDRLIRPAALEMAQAGPFDRLVVLHLSGALGADALDPLRDAGAAVGSCHPLVSLSRRYGEPSALRGASFAVEGDRDAVRAAFRLAKAVGGLPFEAEAAGKTVYHAGAVLASNALVALLDLAAGLLVESGLTRERAEQALLPLVRSTLANAESQGLEGALTGPVRRGDAETVRRHLRALPDGAARRSYLQLAHHTLDLARRAGLDETRAAAIEVVLAEAD